MKLLKKLKQQRINEFNIARVKGTGNLAPRKGEYVFQKFYYTQIGNRTVQIAKCLWKPDNDSVFIDDLIFEVAIHSFLNSKSAEQIENVYDLSDKLISVRNVMLDIKPGMEDKPVLTLSWSHINKTPVIVANSFEYLNPNAKKLNPKAQNFGDIVKQWSESMRDYSVEEFLYQESEHGFGDATIVEDIMEDYIEDPDNDPEPIKRDLIRF